MLVVEVFEELVKLEFGVGVEGVVSGAAERACLSFLKLLTQIDDVFALAEGVVAMTALVVFDEVLDVFLHLFNLFAFLGVERLAAAQFVGLVADFLKEFVDAVPKDDGMVRAHGLVSELGEAILDFA